MDWDYKHFTPDEFDSPDSPGSGVFMNPVFMKKLELARGIAGIPFVITSGFRTAHHNKTVNGKDNSSHLSGFAADLFITNDKRLLQTITALFIAGFTRIGLSTEDKFIHVDCDPNKLPAYWGYS